MIKCKNCIFAKPDPTVIVGKLMGVQCTNEHSDNYRDLLNMHYNGNLQNEITWQGCEHGEGTQIHHVG